MVIQPLLERLKAGESAAYEEVLVRYGGPLRAVLTRTGANPSDVDDLIQETFARLFLNLDRIRSSGSLRPWLFKVAINLSRALRKPPKISKTSQTNPMEGDPELKAHLETEIDRLPEKTRAAFVLREVGGLTTEEVAEAEGCTVEAVRQRITEARRKLREVLTPYLRSFQGA